MASSDMIAQLRRDAEAIQVLSADDFAGLVADPKNCEIIAETRDFVILDGVLADGTAFRSVQGTMAGDVVLMRRGAVI